MIAPEENYDGGCKDDNKQDDNENDNGDDDDKVCAQEPQQL